MPNQLDCIEHRVGTVFFRSTTTESIAATIATHARSHRTGVHVHLLNAYSIAIADKDPIYNRIINTTPAVNLPDGKPLAWTSRLRRDSEPLRQVRGVDFFRRVFDEGQDLGLRHYLLGSTSETLAKLEHELKLQYPDAEIVGTHSPPFRKLSADELSSQDDHILASGADIVWVGLGTPKQDHEAHRIATDLGITTAAVGAAFDFVAGTAREAPAWMSRHGLEWLFRFISEPRRLWRRYIFGNLRFLKATTFPRGALEPPRGS